LKGRPELPVSEPRGPVVLCCDDLREWWLMPPDSDEWIAIGAGTLPVDAARRWALWLRAEVWSRSVARCGITPLATVALPWITASVKQPKSSESAPTPFVAGDRTGSPAISTAKRASSWPLTDRGLLLQRSS
jgi:hypothetical protein